MRGLVLTSSETFSSFFSCKIRQRVLHDAEGKAIERLYAVKTLPLLMME